MRTKTVTVKHTIEDVSIIEDIFRRRPATGNIEIEITYHCHAGEPATWDNPGVPSYAEEDGVKVTGYDFDHYWGAPLNTEEILYMAESEFLQTEAEFFVDCNSEWLEELALQEAAASEEKPV